MEYSDELEGPQVIVPHADWRGTYDRGTTVAGGCLVYTTNGQFIAPPPDSTPNNGDGTRIVGGEYDGRAEHCVSVDWPAAYTWSARQYRRGYDGPISWMGSLIYESRDASGLYYRRNRYYDSEKGRFTQEDPIGLAGGTNLYGYAGGDPVGYSDPYGLYADTTFSGDENGEVARATWNQMRSEAEAAIASGNYIRAVAGSVTLSLMRMVEDSPIMYEINVKDQGPDWRLMFQGHEDCADATHCLIQLDQTQQTSQSLTVRLGHEIGGVILGRRPHFGEMLLGQRSALGHLAGSMIGENAARLMKGCASRAGHNPFIYPATPC